MQTQLAQLHEKYGQEVLKSEQQETLNNENQKVIDSLKSENETLTKKNAELEENYNDKMNENTGLYSTIRELKRSDLTKTESLPNLAAIGNDHPMESKEIGFLIQCPTPGGETKVNCENFKLLSDISGSFELTLKWTKNRIRNPSVSIKPKVTSMISCNLSIAVFLHNKTKKNSTFVCRSKT